jgi:Electron transfer flavoprotein, alpha subunit
MSDKCSTCSISGSCDSGECPTDRLPPGILSEYDLNRPVADGIAVWLETSVTIGKVSLEAVSKAKELDRGRVFGILFGDGEKRTLYSEAFEHGVDTIYHIRSPELDVFNGDAYAQAIREITDRVQAAVLMIPSTDNGNVLMEKISKMFKREFSDLNEFRGPFPVLVRVNCNGLTAKKEIGRKGTAINVIPSDSVRSLIE